MGKSHWEDIEQRGAYMLRVFIGCLWLLTMSAWAIPVKLINTGDIPVYAHPNANEASVAQVPGGTIVDVVATDTSKGYLLINYQHRQVWIKADSVMTSSTTTPNSPVQQTLNQAIMQAGNVVDAAVADAQTKLSEHLPQAKLHQQIHEWTNTQARDWFLLGAFVFFVGLMMGLFIGRVMGRHRRSFLR